MTIDDGVAYGEPFQKADASLRFDGAGVRLDGITIVRRRRRHHRRRVRRLGRDLFVQRRRPAHPGRDASPCCAYPQRADVGTGGVSGVRAAGRSTSRATTSGSASTICSSAEEGVGQVTGSLALRGTELTGDVDAASPRLAMTGTGRIALTPRGRCRADVPLPRQLARSVRAALRAEAVAVYDGRRQRLGPHGGRAGRRRSSARRRDGRHARHAAVRLRAEERDADPARARSARQVRVQQLQLVGEDTQLSVSGSVGLHDEQIALRVEGDANLGILQGFFRNVRGSGRAALSAAVNGPLHEPVFSGQRDDHRRPRAPPVASQRARRHQRRDPLRSERRPPRRPDRDDGRRPRAVRRPDRVRRLCARRSERHGPRRGHAPALPGRACARRSTPTSRCAATFEAPTLGGSVTVRNAVWSRRIDPTAGLFDFGGGGSAGPAAPAAGGHGAAALRHPRARAVDAAHREQPGRDIVASADLQLRGTYDRPVRVRPRRGGPRRGHASRGAATRHARHHRLHESRRASSRSSTSRPRRACACRGRPTGHRQRRRHDRSPAAAAQLRSAAARGRRPRAALQRCPARSSDATGVGDVELRARQNPNERQTDILTTRATQLLADAALHRSRHGSSSRHSASTRSSSRHRWSIPTARRRRCG